MTDEAPFGVNLTKRYVSPGGEKELFQKHTAGNHGYVELVDYMGGDEMVERVATAGHGASIFTENPDNKKLLEHLANNGIYTPFKSVQLKLNFEGPIELALFYVYAQSASINEYSGRYSEMLNSSISPDLDTIVVSDNPQEVKQLFDDLRKESKDNYDKLNSMKMARELARSILGTDNDTKFFWKTDLFSLYKLLEKGIPYETVNDAVFRYVGELESIAEAIAPIAWRALEYQDPTHNGLTMPTDDEIIDGPLSPPAWEPTKTKRVIVSALEEVLFVPETFLDHGEFQVVDYMGDDRSFAQAARVSYGLGTKQIQDDHKLVRSLIRDLHTSPVEMAELAVESKTPVFIDPRQAGRHRTLDNHGFMGFTPVGSQFYLPPESEFKSQDKVNRQGRGNLMDEEDLQQAKDIMLGTFNKQIEVAKKLRNLDAEEAIVRAAKGVGYYTKRWRTGDSHNWGHFLKLRLDPHAQKEIRDYAQLVDKAHKLHVPNANDALHTYVIDGVRLSRDEVNLIREKGLIQQTDLDNLSLYDSVPGFIFHGKKGDKLGRLGRAFRGKLEKLIASEDEQS